MNNVAALKKVEWLSLILIALILASSIYLLQIYGAKTTFIDGEPEFDFSVGKDVLKNPLGVAINKTTIAATNSEKGIVEIFSINGVKKRSIKLPKGSYPGSLAFNESSLLYIGDIKNNSLYRTSAMENTAKKVKFKNEIKPISMAFHNESLLIFDGVSQKIKMLKDSKLVNFVKDKTLDINYANGIYSDGNNVYVADSNARRVLRFDGNGKYLGTLNGFSLPRGIAVDRLQRIHVVDTFAHTVKVFGKDGKLQFNYGSEGTGDKHFFFPNSIAIDSIEDKIYVADKGNNRLQVWSW